jgi:hypothetical protein
MTKNQRRAIRIALRILRGIVQPAALDEADWALLTVAGGAHGFLMRPSALAETVVSHARHRTGYFYPLSRPQRLCV